VSGPRDLLLRLTGAEALAPALRVVGRGVLSILMLHRFTDPELGVVGTDPGALREHLAYLRRHRYRLLGMSDVLACLEDGDGGSTAPAVAFTVDDGYADFARVAAPVFAEFDCPVTLFVTTGFVDRQLWMWWDRVAHLFGQTPRSLLWLNLGPERRQFRWSTPGERARAQDDMIQRLEWVDAPAREAAIDDLARQLGADLPAIPPPAFAPLSWDDVRDAARRGATFGPHTVSHRILSGAPLEACDWEIGESYRRLQQETDAVLPVLCYPNGGVRSFGEREMGAAQRAGLRGAVTAVPGYAGSADRFSLPRFPYPADRPHLVHIVAGLPRFRHRVRASGRSR
jgi:peptidoglycan/xylan/chitin deacetylase (PgdA/CDA1 family)